MPTYKLKIDEKPEAWIPVGSLNDDDLVTELVQNEIDAKSSFTRLSFERNRLICEGDGLSVDESGWERLACFSGAGDKVDKKSNSIGVKNHGLKACFRVGNYIIVRSAGKRTQQTLYRDGEGRPACPGAWEDPIPDSSAPEIGCRIEVPYRESELVAPAEAGHIRLPACSYERTVELFKRACREIPDRFFGVVQPESGSIAAVSKYTLLLRHWHLGTVQFTFRCRVRERLKRFLVFARTCTVGGTWQEKPRSCTEEAALFTLVPMSDEREIPDFYTKRGRMKAEIAWKTNQQNRPVTVQGLKRYPITYAGITDSARTYVGVHYSAPFVSDQERHGLKAGAELFNDDLLAKCDQKLIELLRDYLIPRYGPKALELLIPPGEPNEEVLSELVERLLTEGAIPIAPESSLGSRTRKPKGRSRSKIRFAPRPGAGTGRWSFVIPCFRRNLQGTIHVSPLLAAVCPPNLLQIHPEVPQSITELLANTECPGWNRSHTTFDEDDAIGLLRRMDRGYFDVPSEMSWRWNLENVQQTANFLEIVERIEASDEPFDEVGREKLQRKLMLPDSSGKLARFVELHAGKNVPTDIPGLKALSVVHPDLLKHRLFRRDAWKRRVFDFQRLLELGDLANASVGTRRAFWNWLKKRHKAVPAGAWRELSALPIWPDSAGELLPLEALCRPRAKSVARVLSDVIHPPHREVLGLPRVKLGGRGCLGLRDKPSEEEIEDWFVQRIESFPTEKRLSPSQRKRFREFESGLAVLARDSTICRILRDLDVDGAALDGRGRLRNPSDLHVETKEISKLALMPDHLLDRECEELDRVFPAQRRPTATAILDAFRGTPKRMDVVRPRLDAYERSVGRSKDTDRALTNLPCVWTGRQLKKPSEVAFWSRRGDFWGKWKQRIPVPPVRRTLYREIGVIGAEPDEVTSQQFFRWLAEQDEDTVRDHLPCILRHFNHPRGVLNWWKQQPLLRCLPVEVNGRLTLVHRKDAISAGKPIYLPDFRELEEVLKKEGSPDTMLVVCSHPSFRDPIRLTDLENAGVKSLRKKAAQPVSIAGIGPIESSPDCSDLLERLLADQMAKELRKRLQERDVDPRLVRPDWRDRLSAIKTVRVAPRVIGTFRLRRRLYKVPLKCGLDSRSGTLWIANKASEGPNAGLDAVAERVFVERAKRSDFSALGTAVQMSFRERRVGADGDIDGSSSDASKERSIDLPDPASPVSGKGSAAKRTGDRKESRERSETDIASRPSFVPVVPPTRKATGPRRLVVSPAARPSTHSPSRRQPLHEAATLKVVELFEKAEGRFPIRVDHFRGSESFGCDIISVGSKDLWNRVSKTKSINSEDVVRFIEVKGRSTRSQEIHLEDNQLKAAEEYNERFYIYGVYRDPKPSESYELAVLANPANSGAVRKKTVTYFDLSSRSGAKWFRLAEQE